VVVLHFFLSKPSPSRAVYLCPLRNGEEGRSARLDWGFVVRGADFVFRDHRPYAVSQLHPAIPMNSSSGDCCLFHRSQCFCASAKITPFVMLNQNSPFHTVLLSGAPNMALNPVRFALWTLRDKAAQRRLALR
jgi:hypothetical protein